MHLFNQGIQCELRGEIFVKGKGNVITYWVYPNQNLNVEEAKLSFEMKNSSLVTPSEPILKTKGKESQLNENISLSRNKMYLMPFYSR